MYVFVCARLRAWVHHIAIQTQEEVKSKILRGEIREMEWESGLGTTDAERVQEDRMSSMDEKEIQDAIKVVEPRYHRTGCLCARATTRYCCM